MHEIRVENDIYSFHNNIITGFVTKTEDLSSLIVKQNILDKILKSKKILFAIIGVLFLISTINSKI